MQKMDDVTTSLLRGLKEEATESTAALKEACNRMLCELNSNNPQLMAAEVTKLNEIDLTMFLSEDSDESPSWKRYHHYWESRLLKQLASEIGKSLDSPVEDLDLKEGLKIHRYTANNQLNGICHIPKLEIDKIRQPWEDFRVDTVKKTRDILIQCICEQARNVGQTVLPAIRITLFFPTSSTTNVLIHHSEAGGPTMNCIHRLPSLTLDTNVFLKMKSGDLLTPTKLYQKCPMDLAVTQRIRDDIPFDDSVEQYLTDNYLRIIPSIMRFSFDSKSERFLLYPGYDKPGCTEFVKLAESISNGIKNRDKSPEYLDWDHLHAHYLSGRDIFVTEDQAILAIGRQLKVLGIRVMRFEKLLKFIKQKRIQVYSVNIESPNIRSI